MTLPFIEIISQPSGMSFPSSKILCYLLFIACGFAFWRRRRKETKENVGRDDQRKQHKPKNQLEAEEDEMKKYKEALENYMKANRIQSLPVSRMDEEEEEESYHEWDELESMSKPGSLSGIKLRGSLFSGGMDEKTGMPKLVPGGIKNCEFYKCLNRTPVERCSGCWKIAYCSKECQRLDWKRHKKECPLGFQNTFRK